MENYLTNRDKVKMPKQGKFWCYKCDRYLVHEGEKCPVCGMINISTIKGRFKKVNHR